MPFHEPALPRHPGWGKPIRELGIEIAGTRLVPILREFEAELEGAGVRKLKPRFYLSDEWGVPFGTRALAIPFYLAQPDLTGLHAEQVGFLEGASRADLLRYLRHEMGHVVNYCYKLYERADWSRVFGSIDQPYLEEYRPLPFSRRFVRHLPGWYAQKHPDEDWAETFAVWMTPGSDWRAEYAGWTVALAKLEYCARTMAEVKDKEPLVTASDLDEAVEDLPYSLEDYYRGHPAVAMDLAGLDGALRSIFENLSEASVAPSAQRQQASPLIRKLERELMADVYRWTGHFPERTRGLLRTLAARADELRQTYATDQESAATVALTAFVTALAMNYVHRGSYFT